MQYPIKLKTKDGIEKQFWLSDEELRFGGDTESLKTEVSELKVNTNALTEELSSQKEDIANVVTLLIAVRDALKNGDIPGAIGLLDSFLLDKEVLA